MFSKIWSYNLKLVFFPMWDYVVYKNFHYMADNTWGTIYIPSVFKMSVERLGKCDITAGWMLFPGESSKELN